MFQFLLQKLFFFFVHLHKEDYFADRDDERQMKLKEMEKEKKKCRQSVCQYNRYQFTQTFLYVCIFEYYLALFV